jgi:hypothetical protein
VRASLLNVWPDLSHLFGLHPWDLDRLTPHELESYLDARNSFLDAQKPR